MTLHTPIDPAGCGCTGCLTGASVPLDRATQQQLTMALLGWATICTDEAVTITVTLTVTAEDLHHPKLPTHQECVINLLTAAREPCMRVNIRPGE